MGSHASPAVVLVCYKSGRQTLQTALAFALKIKTKQFLHLAESFVGQAPTEQLFTQVIN